MADTINILKQIPEIRFDRIIASVAHAKYHLDSSSVIAILSNYIGTDGFIDVDQFAQDGLENFGGGSVFGWDFSGEEGDWIDMYKEIATKINNEIRKRMVA